MALDAYGNFSRSVRTGAKVKRVFFGKGPAAQLAAALDDQRRAERRARAEAWHTAEAARAAAEGTLHALDELVGLLMRATMAAAGYHQHDRGPWRKRRMNGNEATGDKGSGVAAVEGREAGPPPGDPGDRALTADELRELLGRAERGDRAVLPALRAVLDHAPALWRHAGDLARVAIADWVDLIAARNLMTRESLTRQVAELKAELAGPDAPPLERLLAERVACTWMQVAHADSAVAGLRGQGATIAQLDLMQRRQVRTHQSFLTAIKALAAVRRLAVAAPPAAPVQAVGAEGAIPRSVSKGRPRSAAAATRATGSRDVGRLDGGDGQEAPEDEAAARDQVMPRVIRDRLRGVVAGDN